MIAALLARFWPMAVAGLAAVAVLVGAYQTGVNAERSRGEAAALRVEVETLRADKRIADQARIRMANDVAELEAAKKQNEDQINALQEIVAERNDPGITQRELDGLLSIK